MARKYKKVRKINNLSANRLRITNKILAVKTTENSIDKQVTAGLLDNDYGVTIKKEKLKSRPYDIIDRPKSSDEPKSSISGVTPTQVVPTSVVSTSQHESESGARIGPPGCTDPTAINWVPNAIGCGSYACYAILPVDPHCCCEYEVEYTGQTISFNEKAKGWTSFKSFIPEFALSSVNQYYSVRQGMLWHHHSNSIRNTFYDHLFDGTGYTQSSITPVLNKKPDIIKNFNALNYEGTQSKISEFTTDLVTGLTDGNYYNLYEKRGWYVYNINTDQQQGTVKEFIEKEGKWFNSVRGVTDTVDTSAFNFQGLGVANLVNPTDDWGCMDPTALNYDEDALFDDGSCIFLDCSGIDLSFLHYVTTPTPGVTSLHIMPDSSDDLPWEITLEDVGGTFWPSTGVNNPNPGGVYTEFANLPDGNYNVIITSLNGCINILGSAVITIGGCYDLTINDSTLPVNQLNYSVSTYTKTCIVGDTVLPTVGNVITPGPGNWSEYELEISADVGYTVQASDFGIEFPNGTKSVDKTTGSGPVSIGPSQYVYADGDPILPPSYNFIAGGESGAGLDLGTGPLVAIVIFTDSENIPNNAAWAGPTAANKVIASVFLMTDMHDNVKGVTSGQTSSDLDVYMTDNGMSTTNSTGGTPGVLGNLDVEINIIGTANDTGQIVYGCTCDGGAGTGNYQANDCWGDGIAAYNYYSAATNTESPFWGVSTYSGLQISADCVAENLGCDVHCCSAGPGYPQPGCRNPSNAFNSNNYGADPLQSNPCGLGFLAYPAIGDINTNAPLGHPKACQLINFGCIDPAANNYDANANQDDGSCAYLGCLDAGSLNGISTFNHPNTHLGPTITKYTSTQVADGLSTAINVAGIQPQIPTITPPYSNPINATIDCLGDVGGNDTSCCSYTVPISFDCVLDQCVDPGTGNGQYTSLNACQAAPCGTPILYDCLYSFFGQGLPTGCVQAVNGQYTSLVNCQTACQMPDYGCLHPAALNYNSYAAGLAGPGNNHPRSCGSMDAVQSVGPNNTVINNTLGGYLGPGVGVNQGFGWITTVSSVYGSGPPTGPAALWTTGFGPMEWQNWDGSNYTITGGPMWEPNYYTCNTHPDAGSHGQPGIWPGGESWLASGLGGNAAGTDTNDHYPNFCGDTNCCIYSSAAAGCDPGYHQSWDPTEHGQNAGNNSNTQHIISNPYRGYGPGTFASHHGDPDTCKENCAHLLAHTQGDIINDVDPPGLGLSGWTATFASDNRWKYNHIILRPLLYLNSHTYYNAGQAVTPPKWIDDQGIERHKLLKVDLVRSDGSIVPWLRGGYKPSFLVNPTGGAAVAGHKYKEAMAWHGLYGSNNGGYSGNWQPYTARHANYIVPSTQTTFNEQITSMVYDFEYLFAQADDYGFTTHYIMYGGYKQGGGYATINSLYLVDNWSEITGDEYKVRYTVADGFDHEPSLEPMMVDAYGILQTGLGYYSQCEFEYDITEDMPITHIGDSYNGGIGSGTIGPSGAQILCTHPWCMDPQDGNFCMSTKATNLGPYHQLYNPDPCLDLES